MKTHQIKSVLYALFFLSGALFIALALGTHNPEDPSFNSIGVRQNAHNACGLFGSFFSDLMFQLFGVTSWGAVGLLLFFAYSFLKRRQIEVLWEKVLAAALLMVTASTLLSLHLQGIKIYQNNIYIGGMIGQFLQTQMTRLFNTVGVGIILWTSLAALQVILFGPRAFEDAKEWILRFFEKIKESYQISRERAELRKAAEQQRTAELKTAPALKIDYQKGAPAQTMTQQEELVDNVDNNEDSTLEPAAPILQSLLGPLKRRRVDLKKKVQRRIANWKLPEIGILEDPPESRYRVDEKEIKMKSALLVDKLGQFAVKGEVKGAKPGPAVTLFEFKPNADVKISKITELADDLSLALSSESVRIIAPIPGRDVVGIETSNSHRETVYLKDVLALDEFWSDDMKLPLALGRQADGLPKVVDLRKMPHLLVAGTTGSGKSVFVVCALTGLLFRHSPQTLRLILIDPKQVDLAAFNNIPHLLLPMVTEPKKAVNALNWAVREMEKRYRSMSKFGARGLESFNEKVLEISKEDIEIHDKHNNSGEVPVDSYYYTPQPYIVIVVEEFGDLMAVDKNNVEHAVVRLAQMARACGIHLILAMQSPRKDVVTGLIKTNIPGRISFKVASKMDSRIIIDDSGAERLLARGDMLFQAPGVAKPERHHGPWVTEAEIAEVMTYWSQQGQPEYDESAMRAITRQPAFSEGAEGAWDSAEGESDDYDERYDEILAWVSGLKSVSASLVQRKFRLGYPRAARLIELFEREGVVGPANGSKPRDVLIKAYEGQKTI
jgi:DNA segregation ATPase FtsK/SpoIIIE, S-DNA-T family